MRKMYQLSNIYGKNKLNSHTLQANSARKINSLRERSTPINKAHKNHYVNSKQKQQNSISYKNNRQKSLNDKQLVNARVISDQKQVKNKEHNFSTKTQNDASLSKAENNKIQSNQLTEQSTCIKQPYFRKHISVNKKLINTCFKDVEEEKHYCRLTHKLSKRQTFNTQNKSNGNISGSSFSKKCLDPQIPSNLIKTEISQKHLVLNADSLLNMAKLHQQQQYNKRLEQRVNRFQEKALYRQAMKQILQIAKNQLKNSTKVNESPSELMINKIGMQKKQLKQQWLSNLKKMKQTVIHKQKEIEHRPNSMSAHRILQDDKQIKKSRPVLLRSKTGEASRRLKRNESQNIQGKAWQRLIKQPFVPWQVQHHISKMIV